MSKSRRLEARESSRRTHSFALSSFYLRLLFVVEWNIGSPRDEPWCLVSSFGFVGFQWMHQASLMERAQSISWSCGCGLSEVSALAVYESSDALSSMAELSSSSETSLCLSSFSHSQGQAVRVVRGGSSSMCLLRRLCSASPAWRSGSTLRSFGSGYLARATASV